MLPQMPPYTPTLYQPGSQGRYRLYPRETVTPIPGAGYHVGEMVWGEQELNLDGSDHPQHHGNYSAVPLRGLGAESLTLTPTMLRAMLNPSGVRQVLQASSSSPGGGSPASSVSPADSYGYDPSADIAAAAAQAQAAQQPSQAPLLEPEQPPFLMRKAGPVPYWAIGALGLAAVAGGGYLVYRKTRRKK